MEPYNSKHKQEINIEAPKISKCLYGIFTTSYYSAEMGRFEIHSCKITWRVICVSIIAYATLVGAYFIYGPVALDFSLGENGI